MSSTLCKTIVLNGSLINCAASHDFVYSTYTVTPWEVSAAVDIADIDMITEFVF